MLRGNGEAKEMDEEQDKRIGREDRSAHISNALCRLIDHSFGFSKKKKKKNKKKTL